MAEERREIGQISGMLRPKHNSIRRLTSYAQALKALVLVQQTDQDLVEQGESEIIDLCYRTPPVTDLEAIKTVQDALRESSLDPVEGEELYARAAAANPSDRVLLMTWLEDCVEDARWQGAQKV